MKLELILAPNPILEQVCTPVIKVNKEIKALSLAMMDLLKEHKALGLAAPQIGSLHKIMVIDTTAIAHPADAFCGVIINPVVIRRNHVKQTRKEKCLSFGDKEVEVTRLTEITVKFRNEHNKVKLMVFKGITARTFQHEHDHLNGIVFTKYEIISTINNLPDFNKYKPTRGGI